MIQLKNFKYLLCGVTGALCTFVLVYPELTANTISTAMASLAGALVAFFFEKNERIIVKRNNEYNQVLILITYFEDELQSLNIDIQTIENIMKHKQIASLASPGPLIEINKENTAFIIEYNSELFKDILKTIRIHERYREELKMQSTQIATILFPKTNTETNTEQIISILSLQRQNAQSNLELTQKTLNSLDKFYKANFSMR